MKTCSVCKVAKPLREFAKVKPFARRPDGRRDQCKQCFKKMVSGQRT